jgi:hypothetical protein
VGKLLADQGVLLDDDPRWVTNVYKQRRGEYLAVFPEGTCDLPGWLHSVVRKRVYRFPTKLKKFGGWKLAFKLPDRTNSGDEVKT